MNSRGIYPWDGRGAPSQGILEAVLCEASEKKPLFLAISENIAALRKLVARPRFYT